jgi:predicted Zn-dependent protease
MKPARSSLFVTFSRILPCSFFLLLAATPIAIAEPAAPMQDSTRNSQATRLLSQTVEDGPTQPESIRGVSTAETAITISSPAQVAESPKSIQAVSVSQFTTTKDSSPLDKIAELTEPIKEATTPKATAPPKSSNQDITTKPAESPETNPSQTKTKSTAPSKATPAQPAKDSKENKDSKESKVAEPVKSPEETARKQKLAEADRLYRQGQIAEAEALYREVKDPFQKHGRFANRPNKLAEPILDPALLPPGGQVYWRESQAGLEKKLETRTLVPLNLLVKQYPQFIPGHLRLAEALRAYGREKEALPVLEKAATQYPSQPDLLKVTIAAQADAEQWLEAAIAARQFALLNPQHPAAPEFKRLADEYSERHQSHLRGELTENAIAGGILGVLGGVLTGNPLAALPSVQTSVLLLRGEEAVGESLTKQAKRQLELVEDPEVVSYVAEIGQKIAATTGRDEFEYEFYVVMNDKLNAFALPGGKVFVNAGAITKTRSEAELAGLLAHELSHAALSHGFQLATEGTATANVTRLLPYGGLITSLAISDYSRDMERQADILGTRVLATNGYAADGMRNLMITLAKEDKESPFTWLSSHPVTDERIRYLEALIEQNGYNRYAYEGVERHAQIQARVAKLLAEHKDKQKKRDR